jgi:hypothetical protein
MPKGVGLGTRDWGLGLETGGGLAMLGLFIVQIVANLRRHPKMSGWLKHHSEHITRGTMPDLSFTRGDGVLRISTS